MLFVHPAGTDSVSTGGLQTGARGLRQPAAVSERRQTAAGVRLHPAGEEGHLHSRQAQVLLWEPEPLRGR